VRKYLIISFLIGVVTICTGCATHSQVLVNAEGQTYRCASWGQGLVGVIQSANIQNDCISSMKAMGYVEIEKASAVGIIFRDSLSSQVLKVIPKSPAEIAGIHSGDVILMVDNISVRTQKETRVLLFGEIGTMAKLRIKREGEQDKEYTIRRAAYVSIFGTPKK